MEAPAFEDEKMASLCLATLQVHVSTNEEKKWFLLKNFTVQIFCM